MDVNNATNSLEERVIQYFTDELGYPRENFSIGISPLKTTPQLPDLAITLFGKTKIILKVRNVPHSKLFSFQEAIRHTANSTNTPYYILTDGNDYFTFETNSNKKLERIPSYEEIKNIQPIHEEIFNFLEEKRKENQNLTYKLRTSNNNNRLDKGYWFLGNDNYIAISFWAGADWKNKTPNIYLTCEPSGKFSLAFSSKDSETKTKFFQNLASILPGFKQTKSKGNPIAFWEKTLSRPSDAKPFLDILEEFIKTDKKIIDTFISNEVELKKNKLDGIDFIPKKEFNKSLKRILDFRKKLDSIPQRFGRINRKSEKFPIALKKLSIQNIGHFRELELDLDYRVICLLGENGIGKSTLLRAVLLGLTGVEETSEIDINRKEIQRLLRITGEGNGLPTFVPKGFISVSYDIDKPFVNRVNFEKIKGESSVKITDDSSATPDSFGATQSGNFLNNLVIGFSQIQSKEKIGTIDTNLEISKKPHIKDILPLLYDIADNRFQELAEWIINLHAASNNNNEVERKVIDFIFEVVSAVVGEKIMLEKVNHLDKLLWVQLNNNDAILFRLISQGFKNVFAWIGYFIKRLAEANDYSSTFMNEPALLLIDEIDTYLHPKWQKNILKVLAIKFPKTQIIVTTHSPLVASHLPIPSKAVYIIKENEVIPVKHIYGKEISSIFYQWMNVKQRPQKVQDQIDLLFYELDKENMGAANKIYDELLTDLGEDDVDLVEAKSYMQLVEN